MKNIFKKNKANLSQNSKSKKSLLGFNFHINSMKQASDYDATMRFVINRMKKTYLHRNDIAKVIQTFTRPDFVK